MRKLLFGVLAAMSLISGSASAQPYPNRPIRMVVPWPAGGIADICGRVMAEGMATALEILIFHPGVAAAIKEGKTAQLISLMQSGKRLGMKIMDDSLMELMQAGTISGRRAHQRAENKQLFEQYKDQD